MDDQAGQRQAAADLEDAQRAEVPALHQVGELLRRRSDLPEERPAGRRDSRCRRFAERVGVLLPVEQRADFQVGTAGDGDALAADPIAGCGCGISQ